MSLIDQPTLGLLRPEREEFADLATAKRAIITRIRRLLNQEAGWGKLDLERQVEISDEFGEVVAVVTFREAAGLQAT